MLLDTAAQDDVGPATGHVRGNGDHTRAAGLDDDFRFACVLLGVQHLVWQLLGVEQARQQLGVFDGRRADQNRLPLGTAGTDVGDDRLVLLLRRAVDLVVMVNPHHRLVGRNHHRFQTIDLLELVGFGIGRSSHPGQLAVHTEEVLEGDRRQRLILVLDRHAFLGLDGLMQAIRPAPPGHQTSSELVNDHHLAVLHHILLVTQEQRVRAQRRIQVVDQQDVGGVVEAAAFRQQADASENLFGVRIAFLRQKYLVAFLIHPVIPGAVLFLATRQHRRNLIHAHIEIGVIFGLPGDDQRRTRLVDQDRIDFVNDGEIQLPLHPLAGRVDHVVAQVVETEFVICAIGDVTRERRLLGGMIHLREIDTDRQPEEAMQPAHPLGVAAGKVVINRDDMHALAGQGIEVCRERRHQGLAFTGTHFGDLAVVQHHAADQLHVEVAHPECTLAGLAHNRKGFGQ